MCGISGVIGLKDIAELRSAVTGMNSCLAHRGPDDEGLFVSDGISLGQRRLSIIDITSSGHQPMFSFDRKQCMVFNGEIYNYRELKARLSDYPYTSNTDSEVILAAFRKWGKDCVHELHGMFAFAIWDEDKRELVVSRDRLGIKPLYYCKGNGFVAFASEIRALLNSGLVARKLNKNALKDYFIYQTVFAPETIIKDVHMLMPGESMVMDSEGNVTRAVYWSTSTRRKEVEKLSYTETCAEVKRLLSEAVEKRMIADVPFGAFLSGGVDSSAIVALMSEVSEAPVKTFSIAFDEKEMNEAAYSNIVASKFKTDHHQINLKASDFLDELPSALSAMDHPSGDGPNSFVVSKATKKGGITMALSGLGGDELFGGYPVFRRSSHPLLPYISKVPAILRGQLASLLTMTRSGVTAEKMSQFLRDERSDLNAFLKVNRQVIPEKAALSLLKETHASKHSQRIFKLDPGYLVSYISEFEINNYMQNVLLRDTDQMSMAHALEVRVPFLDHELVEFVLSVPDRHKPLIPGKKLLIDAMGSLLPEETWNRKKMGFVLPWRSWMKDELSELCASRIMNLSKYGFVYSEQLIRLWEQFRGGDPEIPWTRIWHLVVLSDWLERNSIEE